MFLLNTTHNMKPLIVIIRSLLAIVLVCCLSSFHLKEDITNSENIETTTVNRDQITKAENYKRASILYTKQGEVGLAVESIRNYILETGDFSILESSAYADMYSDARFIELRDDYLTHFNVGEFFYLYIGLIGIFIAGILSIRKRSDKVANRLLGLFVLMHSCFLVHTILYISNYALHKPHTLYMSTVFSFLYGPVLYFYFKRITEKYTFKVKDTVHLLPTLIFIIVLIPIYSLSAEEKLKVMLGVGQYEELPYAGYITLLKITSLGIYGYYTLRLYIKSSKNTIKVAPIKKRLQKLVLVILGVYIISYTLYGIVITTIGYGNIISNIQFFALASLVLFVAYIVITHNNASNTIESNIP